MSECSKGSVCKRIGATELSVRMSESTVLVDVRGPIEFESEHIPQSINLPLNELEARCEELNREKEIVLVCRSGRRAERAAYSLLGKGFRPKVLDGGLLAWRGAGLAVKEGRKRISLERQVQLTVGTAVLIGVMLGVFVSQWFLLLPAFFGAGLVFAGLSGTCGLALLLMKAPWNEPKVKREPHNQGAAACKDAGVPDSRRGCCG